MQEAVQKVIEISIKEWKLQDDDIDNQAGSGRGTALQPAPCRKASEGGLAIHSGRGAQEALQLRIGKKLA